MDNKTFTHEDDGLPKTNNGFCDECGGYVSTNDICTICGKSYRQEDNELED